jgi:hypothetical protein
MANLTLDGVAWRERRRQALELSPERSEPGSWLFGHRARRTTSADQSVNPFAYTKWPSSVQPPAANGNSVAGPTTAPEASR